jgi:hypothetical protein
MAGDSLLPLLAASTIAASHGKPERVMWAGCSMLPGCRQNPLPQYLQTGVFDLRLAQDTLRYDKSSAFPFLAQV